LSNDFATTQPGKWEITSVPDKRFEEESIMNIANKTVLVTGANRGIGRALVEEALRRGAKRVYAGTRGALPYADPRVTPLMLDVTRAAQIEHAAGAVDTLDVLINNAGIAQFVDLSHQDAIKQHLEVNLYGTFNVTRAFAPLLKRSEGAVVNILSLAALASVPVMPAYSVSKAAAWNLTQSLRAILAGQGVRVYAVFPGPIDTDMSRNLTFDKASPESAAQGIFDGLARDDEDIFPDPVSEPLCEGWRLGVVKSMQRQFATLVQDSTADLA
jgi:NAD(P)-dependent dehydrogenase (short-subunit alcohol dehydrogenase family)